MSPFPFRLPIVVPIGRAVHGVSASLLVIAACAVAATPEAPPAAPVRAVSDTRFGVTVQDPYRYLENMKDPEVVAWMKDQADFARATLDHDPSADQYRDEIIKRWGPRAVVSIAFAILTARMYPTVKYAMGHGKACTRIVVGGAPLAFDKSLAGPAKAGHYTAVQLG